MISNFNEAANHKIAMLMTGATSFVREKQDISWPISSHITPTFWMNELILWIDHELRTTTESSSDRNLTAATFVGPQKRGFARAHDGAAAAVRQSNQDVHCDVFCTLLFVTVQSLSNPEWAADHLEAKDRLIGISDLMQEKKYIELLIENGTFYSLYVTASRLHSGLFSTHFVSKFKTHSRSILIQLSSSLFIEFWNENG